MGLACSKQCDYRLPQTCTLCLKMPTIGLTFSNSVGYCTVKSVYSGHSKIDKTKVLTTIGSLMKVESIAEWSRMEHFAIYLVIAHFGF